MNAIHPESLDVIPVPEVTPKTREERIVERMVGERLRIAERVAQLDKFEALIARLPESVIGNVSVAFDSVDLDMLSREQVSDVMRCLSAGRWDRIPNQSYDSAIDYTATIDGVNVRLWAAAAPETCRVVEYEEEIPAQKVKRRKLVCN